MTRLHLSISGSALALLMLAGGSQAQEPLWKGKPEPEWKSSRSFPPAEPQWKARMVVPPTPFQMIVPSLRPTVNDVKMPKIEADPPSAESGTSIVLPELPQISSKPPAATISLPVKPTGTSP